MEEQQIETLILIGIISLVAGIVYFRVKRAKFWTEQGIRASASVTKIIDSGMKGYSSIGFSFPSGAAGFSSGGIIWDMYLDIEQPGLPIRRLNIYHRFKDGFDKPRPGDQLPILIHPKKPEKIVFLPREIINRDEVFEDN